MIKVFVALLCFFAAVVVSLMAGSYWLPATDAINAIFNPGSDFTIHVLRMPRVVLAIMVGSLLAVSGLVLQTLLKNPLASPDIVGVTGGASVAAVLFISVTSISIVWLPLWALSGGLIAASILLYFTRNASRSISSVVLIGICITSACGSLVTMFLVMNDTATAAVVYTWLTGTLYGANWDNVSYILPWWMALLPLPFLLLRPLKVLPMSDELLIALGLPLKWITWTLILVSVAMASIAIAFAGAIGFVGLIVPQIARIIEKHNLALQFILCPIIGATVLVLADLAGRTLFLPKDLPAGIFVALAGAPILLWLLWKTKHQGEHQ